MEQLNSYIQQARQQGQSDEQIHQALVSAGRNPEHVNSVLGIPRTPPSSYPAPQATVIHGGFQTAANPYTRQAPYNSLDSPSNSNMPEAIQQPSPINNKKPKLLLTLICSLVVLVVATGGTYAIFGRSASHKSVTCTSQSCFQQHFISCSPATLNNANTTGIKYAINGPEGKGCNMTVEYAYNPNPAWKNKPMTCTFNNNESYGSDVGQALLDLSAKSNPDTCTGPLVKLLESQSESSTNAQPATSSPSTASATQLPATTPAPASSPSSQPTTPAPIALTNDNNGQTISAVVGQVLNIQLAQLPNGAGFHWADLAESTSTWQLGSAGVARVQGSDGSLTESHKILSPGDFTLGYADNANCSPGCAAQEPPLELWQVHVDVA